MMKICFIGLGSIGKRHFRNIISILDDKEDLCIDAIRSTDSIVPNDISCRINKAYKSIDEAPYDYDIAFITNPTSLHFETIKNMVKHTKNMFIEKPVFHTPIENIDELGLRDNGIYYVAAPLRYGPIISKIKDMVQKEKVYSVRAISSSYLPDWRKGQDYRKNYSAHKNMGGGVALDIIHEIDYLTYIFGMPKDSSYYGGKFSSLEIDSDDLATYMLKYDDKIIEIHLDYFGRKTTRQIEVYCEEYTIVGDLVDNILKKVYCDHIEMIDVPVDEDYIDEMKSFIKMINGDLINGNSIEHANKVLKIALGEK